MNNRYHIRLKDKEDGRVIDLYNDVFDPQNGVAFFQINKNWELIFTRKDTGRKDCEGNELFDGDIIEFDRREWGGDDNIHVISWNNENSEWCWGGGSASDMEWRTKIGNIYDNPELIPDEE